MATLPLISVKGSPGTTTLAAGLGATWPQERPDAVVIEFDPAGGDVAARFTLGLAPGLVSLSVAVDRGDTSADGAGLVLSHAQQLPGGLRVIVAPTSPTEMRVPLDRLAEELPLLAHDGLDLIVDCGRLETRSLQERTPVMRLIQRAGIVVVVARPVLAELQHLHAWLPGLIALRVRVVLLLSQKGDYEEADIATTLEVPIIGHIPVDPLGAAFLSGGGGRLPARLLPLFGAARRAATAIAAELPASRPTVVGLVERA